MRNREIVGRFLGENYVFGEAEQRTIIGELAVSEFEQITVKGHAADNELTSGLTYRFYGHMRQHPRYGEQFNFSSFVVEKPVDAGSIKTYLRRLCGGPKTGSVSPAVADALIEQFGTSAIDVLIGSPVEAVAAVQSIATRSNWNDEKARRAVAVLREHENTRSARVELINLFDGRKFPKKTVSRAIREWGNAAARVIRENPYVLMRLPGIGFLGADHLYCDISREQSESADDLRDRLGWMQRQAYAARHAITTQRDGSIWYPEALARSAVQRFVSGIRADPERAIEAAISDNLLTACERDGRRWVAIPRLARHERTVAEVLNDLLEPDGVGWPAVPADSDISDHQREGLAIATSRRVGVLAGSPGCGKTFTIAALVNEIRRNYGDDQVAIACPTGKAAVRCSEALSEQNIRGIDVATIHRLLIVQKNEGDDGWSFYYDEQNALPQKFIIVDESSMIDVSLAAALLRALAEGSHVLFVGDAGQLPPVGQGKPFLDMQEIVPTGRLTEIRRNSGRIVRACAEMRDRKTFTPSEKFDIDAGENLAFIQVDDPQEQIETVERLLQSISEQGEDAVWDTQVVCPINRNSPVSRWALNQVLQKRQNPHGDQVRGNPFRVGDKVVCLQNGWYLATNPDHPDANDDGNVFVANGELAEVVGLQVDRMRVRLFQPDREIMVPHRVYEQVDRESGDDNEDKGALGDWDLGYALSVHKSQGSQWKYVVVVVDSSGSAKQVQNRNWLFTAISRAAVATFCIGDRRVADAMVRKDGIVGRKTFLVEECRRDVAVKTWSDDVLFSEVV